MQPIVTADADCGKVSHGKPQAKHLDGQKKPQRAFKVFRPLKAIRLNCVDCSGFSPKAVLWCPLDGVHSTRCHFCGSCCWDGLKSIRLELVGRWSK